MSTTYTPNPANVQAPAAASTPDNLPLETLAADGDALNAASVAQAFKVLGDYIAWLKAPFGVVSSYVQALRNYRSAIGNRVSGVDHFGFPGGRLHTITEDWLDAAATNKTVNGSGAWFGKWNYGIFGPGGTGNVTANGANAQLTETPLGPIMFIDFNGTAGAAATVVESAKRWMYVSEGSIEFEFDFSVGFGSTIASNTHVGFGLGSGTFVSSGSVNVINQGTAIPSSGAFLYRDSGSSNWIAQTLKPGGGSSNINTGIPLDNVVHRYKIVMVGTADSDDATARVLHYLDGALVLNGAIDLETAFLYPFFRIGGNQADNTLLAISAIKFTPRLVLGDAPI